MGLVDSQGRPYEWWVGVSEPHLSEQSRFYAGFASWEGAALVMTRAIPAEGNPSEPADRMVIVPIPGTVIVIRYVRPES